MVTSETVYLFQPKTEPIYAELKGYEVLENTARYAKILLKHELTVPVSADEKLEEEQKASLSLWSVRLDVQKNWQAFLWKLRWLSSLIIHKSLQDSLTNTAKDHRIRLLVKTHNASSNDSESIWVVTTKQTSCFMGKSEILNTNKPLSVCMIMKRVTVSNKDWMNTKSWRRHHCGDHSRASGELGDWRLLSNTKHNACVSLKSSLH